MGGSIEVVSEKGKGSTFRFYIKAKTCRTSPATGNGLRANIKAQRNTARYFGLRRKPHVLIVEDNLINQTVLARQLKHCNLTCDGQWCKPPEVWPVLMVYSGKQWPRSPWEDQESLKYGKWTWRPGVWLCPHGSWDAWWVHRSLPWDLCV